MSNEQNNTVDEQTQAAPEPTDIAQAFKMVNEANRAPAEEPVASEEAPNPEESPEGGAISEGNTGTAESFADTSGSEPVDTSGNVGGSPAIVEPVDYSPAKQDILKNIQSQAIEEVRNEMRNQKIELWTMNDIYSQDENTGRVTFRNPDDPDHPFSSRAEAQSWINAINEEIQNHFRNEVNKKQQELVQRALPTLQMIDFAPIYQSMNKTEQDVFNDLIEPYTIKDNSGKVVGFNVNLQSVANTAKQIAKRFGTNQPAPEGNKQETDNKQVSRPAMDIKSGNGVSPDENEPKNLGEALKRYDEMNRKKKEGK